MITTEKRPAGKTWDVTAVLFLWAILFPCLLSGQESTGQDTVLLSEVEVVAKSRIFYPLVKIESRDFEVSVVRDLGDFMRSEPNVAGIRKGGVAIDPVVRGFKYSQVTVLLNGGVKIEGGCPNRMDPVAAHVESENIRSVEIIKGPYVLKYGPVSGALVDLQTNQPVPYEKPTIHGEVRYGFESNWNGQREHIAVWGGNSRLFFNASAGYKGYGSYTAGNDVLFNTSFSKKYLTAGAGFLPAKNHKIIINYAYDEGKNIKFPALPMDERLDQTHVGSVNYTGTQLGGVLRDVEFQGYFSPVHHVMDNRDKSSAKTMLASTTVDAWNAGGKLTGTFLSGEHRILAGIDFEHVFKDGDKEMQMKMIMGSDTFMSVKHANVWLDANTNNAGVFAEYVPPVKQVELVFAVRFDYNQANSGDTFRLVKNDIHYFDDLTSRYFNVSFSAGLRTRLMPWLWLNAGIGRGTRSASVLERYIKLMPVQYDSYDYLGNPQLKPETNHQADISFDFPLNGIGLFSAGGFFSVVSGYITCEVIPPSVIKPSTQGAPGVKQFVNRDLVCITGFEASYQSPAGKRWGVSATVAATYGTDPEAVKYILAEGQVIGQETVKNDPLAEIPPLEGTIVASWKFLKGKLVPRATLRMVSEQNRVSESYGEPATPGFVTAGLSLAYTPCRFASFSAGVGNMLNQPYYEHLNRRIVGSTARLYEPGRVWYITARVGF